MNTTSTISPHSASHVLRFTSLFDVGRGLAFPCDAAGHVELDALSDLARLNYFYARKVIGREFFAPAIQPDAAFFPPVMSMLRVAALA